MSSEEVDETEISYLKREVIEAGIGNTVEDYRFLGSRAS
jgi:predicted DNA-binding protein